MALQGAMSGGAVRLPARQASRGPGSTRASCPAGSRSPTRPAAGRMILLRAAQGGNGKGISSADMMTRSYDWDEPSDEEIENLKTNETEQEIRERGGDLVKRYFYDDWKLLRSAGRYWSTWQLLFDWSHGAEQTLAPVLPRISGALGVLTAISAATCAMYSLLPELPVFSFVPFAVVTPVISLLLVFRTNAGYGRWLDAQDKWAVLTNRIRDLNRQARLYFPQDDPAKVDERLRMLQRWSVVLMHSLKISLRGRGNLEKDLRNTLSGTEFKALQACAHKPIYAIQVMSEVINKSGIPLEAKSRMDRNLTFFHDAVGASERILRTPIPVSYTRHTSRILMVWLATMPLGLWGLCGWVTVPVTLIISFMVLGIDDIGVCLEEPFPLLPCDSLAKVVDANMQELVETHSMTNAGSIVMPAGELVNKAVAVPVAIQEYGYIK